MQPIAGVTVQRELTTGTGNLPNAYRRHTVRRKGHTVRAIPGERIRPLCPMIEIAFQLVHPHRVRNKRTLPYGILAANHQPANQPFTIFHTSSQLKVTNKEISAWRKENFSSPVQNVPQTARKEA